MTSSTIWQVGIIGYGFSAKIFHIPFIQHSPHFNLHAVVQRNPTPDNNVTTDFPGVTSYHTTEDMLQDATVNIVIVTTPPDTHFRLTKLALEAGKHGPSPHCPSLPSIPSITILRKNPTVVCEKPFTPTSAAATELATLATKQGKLLSVFQSTQHPPPPNHPISHLT